MASRWNFKDEKINLLMQNCSVAGILSKEFEDRIGKTVHKLEFASQSSRIISTRIVTDLRMDLDKLIILSEEFKTYIISELIDYIERLKSVK
jgi:hypothetical protein